MDAHSVTDLKAGRFAIFLRSGIALYSIHTCGDLFVRVDRCFLWRLWRPLNSVPCDTFLFLYGLRLFGNTSLGAARSFLRHFPIGVVHDTVVRVRNLLAVDYRGVVGAAL